MRPIAARYLFLVGLQQSLGSLFLVQFVLTGVQVSLGGLERLLQLHAATLGLGQLHEARQTARDARPHERLSVCARPPVSPPPCPGAFRWSGTDLRSRASDVLVALGDRVRERGALGLEHRVCVARALQVVFQLATSLLNTFLGLRLAGGLPDHARCGAVARGPQ